MDSSFRTLLNWSIFNGSDFGITLRHVSSISPTKYTFFEIFWTLKELSGNMLEHDIRTGPGTL